MAVSTPTLVRHRGPMLHRGPTAILIIRWLPFGAREILPTVLLIEEIFLGGERCCVVRVTAHKLIKSLKSRLMLDPGERNQEGSAALITCTMTLGLDLPVQRSV